jgi:hypothetical protein
MLKSDKDEVVKVENNKFILPKLNKKYKKWYNLTNFKEYNENEEIDIFASTVIKAI